MQLVPISDQFLQTLNVQLAGQSCRIDLRTKSTGLYCSLYTNDTLVIGGVKCQNLNRIVRSVWLGFSGDLMFNDTQGTTDPRSPGLGSRYQLFYLTAADLQGVG